MNLFSLLEERVERSGAIRIGLIGAGKFASMFLAQVPHVRGLEVARIADLAPDRARAACRTVGWDDDTIAATAFDDDGAAVAGDESLDVIVEATGDPLAGLVHAETALAAGNHIVMVNVEADVLAGPLLAERARAAGLVMSMAYGDQPALVAEMVDWARACGFRVMAAGKGTKYLRAYHALTPETVWDHYGIDAEQAAAAGMNAKMFNSFMDGTKSGIEMAAIANATGLSVPDNGLAFPPCGSHELASLLKPVTDGGILAQSGTVEVISSLRHDGKTVENDLRWGVYVTFMARNRYAADCFAQYGVATDDTGKYAALYRPYHLIGLELNVSILSAALRGEATGTARGWRGDVVAVAKRDLEAGETLDGEGGSTVWGKLVPAAGSLERRLLPIGLASGVPLTRPIKTGEPVSRDDVTLDESHRAHVLRTEMETRFTAS